MRTDLLYTQQESAAKWNRDTPTTQGLTDLFLIASRDFIAFRDYGFFVDQMWSSYHLVNFCEYRPTHPAGQCSYSKNLPLF